MIILAKKMKLKTQAMEYKRQRDLLAYYLLEEVGITRVKLAKILGVSKTAISFQFPKNEE